MEKIDISILNDEENHVLIILTGLVCEEIVGEGTCHTLTIRAYA